MLVLDDMDERLWTETASAPTNQSEYSHGSRWQTPICATLYCYIVVYRRAQYCARWVGGIGMLRGRNSPRRAGRIVGFVLRFGFDVDGQACTTLPVLYGSRNDRFSIKMNVLF